MADAILSSICFLLALKRKYRVDNSNAVEELGLNVTITQIRSILSESLIFSTTNRHGSLLLAVDHQRNIKSSTNKPIADAEL